MMSKTKYLTVVLALGLVGVAAAGPVGTNYTVQGVNFPNDFPTTSVLFDGVPELLGGPAPNGIFVNESATPRTGTPGGIVTNQGALTEWSQDGIVTEFTFNSADNGPYNNLPGSWQLSVHEIDFGTNKAIEVKNTQFAYFFGATGPVVLSPTLLAAFNLTAGPHPTNPAITQVLYLKNSEHVFDMTMGQFPGFDILNTSGNLNANTVAILAGVATLKGIGLGSMYQPIPEPSSLLLAGIGAVGLLLAARRRRQQG